MSYQSPIFTVKRPRQGVHLDFSFNPPVPRATFDSDVYSQIRLIPKTAGRYAGFHSLKKLKKFLHDEVYGHDQKSTRALPRLQYGEIFRIVQQTLTACDKIVPLKGTLTLGLFPSANSFTRTKMQGVSGYTSNQYFIFLFIAPGRGWQQALARTIAHEYAHTCAFRQHQWRTLLDALIFEGLAEHFRAAAIKGPVAPWSRAITPARAKKIFRDILPLLHQPDEDWYEKIFLGSDERYPCWTGYTIGYQVIRSFLARRKKNDWRKIMTLKPNKILASARY